MQHLVDGSRFGGDNESLVSVHSRSAMKNINNLRKYCISIHSTYRSGSSIYDNKWIQPKDPNSGCFMT